MFIKIEKGKWVGDSDNHVRTRDFWHIKKTNTNGSEQNIQENTNTY